ncbi:cyclin-like protein [Myriangium duriaei CBS 260.36]|uniref:RNA polymerase II holoenzyme cyclin-like subunit n=1 Tax=Myriangium duriaei CBS 260.36 TaxID=1168546 RepID=A0A9P4MM69_9PEZI|nr:cyclin-like protein [Myriangium duriaei CBS 260.36]
MAQTYNEDELYRASSQYRFWSFSPTELAALRASTHSAALDRASHYLQDAPSTCLTLDEELRLVQRYSEQVRTTSDFFKWSINVKSTAVQYLKRFYLTNSVMTYPPKEIYKSVLFLASKTEAVHMTLAEYARRIKTDKSDILAPEYKIIQSLRFTLDVRHPFRGLRGVLMELLNIAESAAPSASPHNAPSSHRSLWSQGAPLPDRAHAAYAAARQILDAPALLTDAYFLYTPPQLALAALWIADTPLAEFYLAAKLQGQDGMRGQVLAVVRECADVLLGLAVQPVMTKDQRAELEVKLEACRDPGTKDLVAVDKAAKVDGLGAEEAEEKARRKAEKNEERRKNDDVFGPAL